MQLISFISLNEDIDTHELLDNADEVHEINSELIETEKTALTADDVTESSINEDDAEQVEVKVAKPTSTPKVKTPSAPRTIKPAKKHNPQESYLDQFDD